MKCDFCGNESPAGSQFCVFCGRDFPQPEPEVRLPIVEPDPAPPVIRPTVQTSPPPDPAPLEQTTPPAAQTAAERLQATGEKMQRTGKKIQATGRAITSIVVSVFALVLIFALLKSCLFPAKKQLTGDTWVDYSVEMRALATTVLDKYITDYKIKNAESDWTAYQLDEPNTWYMIGEVSRSGVWQNYICVMTVFLDEDGEPYTCTPHYVVVGPDVFFDDGFIED